MLRHFERDLADDAGDYVTWMGFACKEGDGRLASRYQKQRRIFLPAAELLFTAKASWMRSAVLTRISLPILRM